MGQARGNCSDVRPGGFAGACHMQACALLSDKDAAAPAQRMHIACRAGPCCSRATQVLATPANCIAMQCHSALSLSVGAYPGAQTMSGTLRVCMRDAPADMQSTLPCCCRLAKHMDAIFLSAVSHLVASQPARCQQLKRASQVTRQSFLARHSCIDLLLRVHSHACAPPRWSPSWQHIVHCSPPHVGAVLATMHEQLACAEVALCSITSLAGITAPQSCRACAFHVQLLLLLQTSSAGPHGLRSRAQLCWRHRCERWSTGRATWKGRCWLGRSASTCTGCQ